VDLLETELEILHRLASGFAQPLQQRMQALKDNVRGEYHTLIVLTWTTAILSWRCLACW